jgi:predicted nuclease of predicted toxin-antitoxin system
VGCSPTQAADCDILACALDKHATFITLDADFHAILAVSRAGGPSVIRLRMQGLIRKVVIAFEQT